jgi:hypothetical protein
MVIITSRTYSMYVSSVSSNSYTCLTSSLGNLLGDSLHNVSFGGNQDCWVFNVIVREIKRHCKQMFVSA